MANDGSQFNGKRKMFGYGQDNTKGGRPKKIYTILKEKGFSKSDITTAFGEMAWYTVDELREVHKDKTKPVIMRMVANQFDKALSKSDWSKIKEILEHVIGKPHQSNSVGVTLDTGLDVANFKIGHKPLDLSNEDDKS